MSQMKLGAIEAGGTKFVCGVGTGPGDLILGTFPTTAPDETLGRVLAFFQTNSPVGAVGIGSFGPVDLRTGFITTTPKPGWKNFDLKGTLERGLGVPAVFETDVNAAALGESIWGAARGLSSAVYITVGTGIGGGVIADGTLVHGLVHPEIGHLRIPHDRSRDPFAGSCPYHGDCLEGLASGPALKARWGVPGAELPNEHPAWALEAEYLALAAVNIALTLSPERIILGGGVMSNEFLFPLLRNEFLRLMAGYVQHESILNGVGSYIVPPGLGSRSGVLGALALASSRLNGRAAIPGVS